MIKTEPIIIDVREPKEYQDYHMEGTINMPTTTTQIQEYEKFRKSQIYLICQSGSRALEVKNKLLKANFKKVDLYPTQMCNYHGETIKELDTWTVDRQFRMTLGLILLIFLIGNYFGVSAMIVLPIILCVGLIFTSIIDKCYLRILISKMPWNKGKSESY